MNETPDRRDAMGVVAAVLALVAVIVAVIGVGLGARAIDETRVESAGPASAGPARPTPDGAGAMSADEMDKVMHDRAARFPEETEGTGGELMEPTVLPDGTKQFDLTAEIIEWEVEKGKTVEAWAYNGQVPGPTIKVNVGDKVRVNLINKLKESTVLHFHGIDVPNELDGVPDVTQAPVKPGASYTYEFTATEVAVGMYHSHHNAQVQVPMGLLGAFRVGQLALPGGVTPSQEVDMVLNDAGQMGFTLNGKSFPATKPIVAKVGEPILLHYYSEGLQIHPMHTHGFAGTVVAKDGIPLSAPYKADTLNVAPGERYSVLIVPHRPGVWALHCHILTHAERADGMFGMVTAMGVE